MCYVSKVLYCTVVGAFKESLTHTNAAKKYLQKTIKQLCMMKSFHKMLLEIKSLSVNITVKQNEKISYTVGFVHYPHMSTV